MAQWHLPRWSDIDAKTEGERDPLEQFIYDNTPSGHTREAMFREELFNAIFAAIDSIAASQSNPGGERGK